MKKVHLLWASLAALALAACNTTMEIDDAPEGFHVLSVQASKAEATKTSYADDKTFSWSVDDQVSILCNDGSVNNWETFTATDAAASSTLTATVASSTELGALSGGKPALYPASDNHEYTDDSDISFYLPAERDFRASEGGHEEAAIPMFAWGDASDDYAFANMTGAVKFSFSGLSASVTQVKFTFTSAGEKLNGLFPLTGLDSGNAADVSWNTATAENEAEKTLTFYADVKNGTAHFYVPYPTGTLAAGSTIRLDDATSLAVICEMTLSGSISVTKNQIVVLPPIILGPTSLTFTESDEDIVNPERGFSDVSTITFATDGSYGGSVTYNENNSLVHIMFYLKGFIKADNINETALNNIRGILDEVRASGKKVIIRFAYETSPTAVVKNAVKSRVLDHIDDLAPIFTAYEDVIYVVQAGFLGAWGEWYPGYTTGFAPYSYAYDPAGSDGNTNIVTGEGGREEVLAKLLAVVPASRQIALRTPQYKMAHVDQHKFHWTEITGWDDENKARRRLSFHNDAFRSKFNSDKTQNPTGQLPNDMGTFLYKTDREMWMQQSAYLAIGGETATIDEETFTTANFNRAFSYPDPQNPGTFLSYAGADNTIQALYDYHYSYLNGNPANDFIKKWTSDGCITDIRKALGYRLWLSEAYVNIPALSTGTECTVTFTLNNSGAAPVINPRPMKLVLIQNGAATELADFAYHVREVASNGQETFNATFNLPEDIKGGAKLALWLPDDAAGLRTKSAYSIRLANNETSFEGTHGFNVFYTF